MNADRISREGYWLSRRFTDDGYVRTILLHPWVYRINERTGVVDRARNHLVNRGDTDGA